MSRLDEFLRFHVAQAYSIAEIDMHCWGATSQRCTKQFIATDFCAKGMLVLRWIAGNFNYQRLLNDGSSAWQLSPHQTRPKYYLPGTNILRQVSPSVQFNRVYPFFERGASALRKLIAPGNTG